MRQLGRQLRRSDQNRWFGRQPQMMGDLLMMLSPGPGYTFWRARCRFRTRNDRIKSVPSIDQTAGWQCWELIRIPASRVVPPAFRLSPSGWSGYVRCPSGFSLFRKSEGLGIPFVQGDGHRLSANIVLWKADASSCGVMWSAFTSAHKQKLKSLRLGKGEAAWLGSTCCEHQNVAEIFLSLDTQPSPVAIVSTWLGTPFYWCLSVLIVLKALTTNSWDHRIGRHFLAELVRIMTSDKALFSPCFYRVADMADLVQADDLARLVVLRRHLRRAFFKPEMLPEVRHELLQLLAGWSASGCAKRFRFGRDGGLTWGTSSCWNIIFKYNNGSLVIKHYQTWVPYAILCK